MVDLAQLVRASDCGSEGHRFETDIPPQDREDGESHPLFCVYHFATIP